MGDQTLDSTPSPSDQPQPPPPPPLDGGSATDPPLTRNSSFSKLNAQAPEFVPMKTHPNSVPPPPPPPSPPILQVYPVPVQGAPVPHMHHHHHHPHHHHHHHQNHPHHQNQKSHGQQDKDHGHGQGNNASRNGLSEEATQKLINQVEFYFSDVNLATTDHLIRFINKDPEGFVPISVVASFKKIKALISSNAQLAAVLRKSTKLVVSDDGKKVKRLHPLTGSDMEELQARIIVAENLPEDHCHQNLMRIFSAVGSVKSIRTCLPQPSNNGSSSASRSSKNDSMLYSNKVHAFVEYESVELAEKAIAVLNDEDDWRNGLRIRLLHKCGSKSAQLQAKKAGNEGEVVCEEEDASTSEQNQADKHFEDPSRQTDIQSHENGEEQGLEKEGGQRKGRHRGRGKGRGKGQHYHQTNRGNHVGPTPTPINNAVNGEQPTIAKQQPPGPRMPDGTRGFSMGRGRPVTVNSAA